MVAKILSSAVIGIDAYMMEVEVDISHGLPTFTIVGLPEAAVKESKERVKAAVANSGYTFPAERITVNLAPAHIKKEGTGFDLPMAMGILQATGIVSQDVVANYPILGELSLDGRVKPVFGCLPMAIAAKAAGYPGIIVPAANGNEAAVVQGIDVIPVETLHQAVDFLRGMTEIAPVAIDIDNLFGAADTIEADFCHVMGQEHVKRALEVAAAGSHNLMMVGSPGTGKTMLARRLSGILPPLSFDEAIETTKIFSISGMLAKSQALVTQRPFRAPHHTISDAGLIGGGQVPKPGEVSLANNGVLFLDELAEFKKYVLELLRQPLEDQSVTIARATTTITYPSRFMLVAAMNPCPCGYLSDPKHECRCTPSQVQKYRAKISGPLLDRIDIHVEVPAVPYKDLICGLQAEKSESMRERVIAARKRQSERFARTKIYCNAQMNNRQINRYCVIDQASEQLLEKVIQTLGLSARAYHRILKVARTIADLDGKTNITVDHISEAVQYRSLDRKMI